MPEGLTNEDLKIGVTTRITHPVGPLAARLGKGGLGPFYVEEFAILHTRYQFAGTNFAMCTFIRYAVPVIPGKNFGARYVRDMHWWW